MTKEEKREVMLDSFEELKSNYEENRDEIDNIIFFFAKDDIYKALEI